MISSFRVLLLTALVGLVGCRAPEEEDNTEPADAGWGIRGTRRRHFVSNGVEEIAPLPNLEKDLAFWTLADGGFTPMTVTSPAPGEFFVEGAPEGPYVFRVYTRYFYRDARELNLDDWDLGRADAGSLTVGLSGTATLTGLPDDFNETLSFVSGSAGVEAYFYFTDSAAPPAVTDASWEMSGHVSFNTVRPGDDFTLCASTGGHKDNLSYSSIASYLRLDNVTIASDTSTLKLEGALTPAPTQPLSFAWRASEFDALRFATHPAAIQSSREIRITLSASGLDKGWVGANGDLFVGTVSSTRTPVDQRYDLTIGNPFPATWGYFGTVTHFFTAPTRLPGSTAGGISSMIRDRRPLADFQRDTLRPRLWPAKNLRVDGMEPVGEVTLSSLTPRISWEPPEGKQPTDTKVRIIELGMGGGSTTVSRRTVELDVLGNQLTVPPEVLTSGKYYAFQIRLMHQTLFKTDVEPLSILNYVDGSVADVTAGPFLAP